MFASTTQETSNRFTDAKRKESLDRAPLLRSISTLDPIDFNLFIQQQYGALWGTLKFEDSLNDYSTDVSLFVD